MATLQVDKIAQARGVNMSRLQVDSKLGMSIVARYWHNKVRAVSLDVLEALARALRVQVTDLIDNDATEVQGADILADIERLRATDSALAQRLYEAFMNGSIGTVITDDKVGEKN